MSCIFFVFFKQHTAYEMRISDWSSDVCSSDLSRTPHSIERRPLGHGRARDDVPRLGHHRLNHGAYRRKRRREMGTTSPSDYGIGVTGTNPASRNSRREGLVVLDHSRYHHLRGMGWGHVSTAEKDRKSTRLNSSH